MNDSSLPAWAREDAFPLKPEDAPFGCMDQNGKSESFEDLNSLKEFLSSGKSKLGWIWVPEHDRLVAPEELPSFEKSLLKRRALLVSDDEDSAKRNLLIFGVVLVYTLYAAIRNGSLLTSQSLGLATILFLILGLKPFWESRQALKGLSSSNIPNEVPEARFELWLGMQKVWVTPILLGLVVAVYAVQFFYSDILKDPTVIERAGINKAAYRAGESWRIFSGAFLHGGLLHLGMNASALWYLGRRGEILARWPHVVAVFFLSILGAGWATVTFMPHVPSVGVSGAVSGLLGFLLVFETLHRSLVPSPVRMNLFGMLVLMVVIGALGFRFIDNAAHAGGLVTGAAYAAIVFPKSSSPQRPEVLGRDRFIGSTALAFSALSGLLAIVLIMVKK